MKELLRGAVPPVDTNLRRDLWPRMHARLQPAPRLSRLDWALAAAVLIWIVMFPQSVIALLYHL
jgi:hypothetical protein